MNNENEADDPVVAEDEQEGEDQVELVLQYIGFNEAEVPKVATELEFQRGLICFAPFEAKRAKELAIDLKEKGQTRRVTVGSLRINRIRDVAHWVQDKLRINEVPDLQGMDEDEFLAEIRLAGERAKIREANKEANETMATKASPGKLTKESEWTKWLPSFENQLSMLLGVRGVPLTYVIRKLEVPDPETVFDGFEEECIAKCPLSGPEFEADAKTVHQLITSNVTGETAEQWIKEIKRHKNGRMDIEALTAHHAGQGNLTRRATDAARMEKTLFYKEERALSFSSFLSKLQTMFNIYEEVGEKKTEGAKLRILLEKIQSARLMASVEAVRTQVAANPASFNFASASSFIGSQVETRVTGRTVSFVGTNDPAITDSNGNIKTGYISGWWDLTAEQREAVEAERERTGKKKKGKGNGKGGRGGKGRGQGGATSKKDRARINKLERQIKALQKRSMPDVSSGNDEDTAESTSQAGTAFGGRSEHARSKKKQKE